MPDTKMNWVDVTALVLVVIGALNWGLVGLFDFNLVSAIFGVDTFLSNLIYIVVGIAGLYTIWTVVKAGQQTAEQRTMRARHV